MPQKNKVVKIVIVLLVFLSVVLRLLALPYSNRDMTIHNLQWYQALLQKGLGNALLLMLILSAGGFLLIKIGGRRRG